MRTSVLFVVWFLSTVSVALAEASQDRLMPQTVLMRDLPLGATITRHVPGDGHPLTLQTALDEAFARNPRLIALRRQYDAMRHRPTQALALAPPSFEAQIWQWPLHAERS